MTQFSAKSHLLAAGAVFVSFSAFAQQGSNPNGNMSPSTASPGGHMNDTNSKSGMKGMDMKFAHEAAIGGMEEVQLGNIAVQKGGDQVKQLGQRIVDDHNKANDSLKSIASKNNMTLPTELDAKAKATVDKFTAMSSGPAFDRAYLRAMVSDHTKDIAEFQKEADSGTNSDLKSFATTNLPTLQEHLRMAKDDMGSAGTSAKK